MYRIGGDIEIDTSLLLSTKKREITELTREYEHIIWTDIGRSALYLALKDIEKRKGKKIAYLPSFICDAVKQPFIECNFQVKYYSMGYDLQTPTFLPETLNGEVFLFVNYFGHYNYSVSNWISKKKKENTFYVIEDCAQAAFTVLPQNNSDYIVYSYRKFTPQPDGALLIGKNKFIIGNSIDRYNEEFLNNQVKGKIIRSLTEDSSCFLNLLKSSECSLDNRIIPHQMSQLSIFLMERIDFNEYCNSRKKNWVLLNLALQENMSLKNKLHAMFHKLEEWEVPLGYPLVVYNGMRNNLRSYLMQHNIFCPIHWNISYAMDENDDKLSASIITLPIDQRMNEEHILYLIKIINQFYLKVEK